MKIKNFAEIKSFLFDNKTVKQTIFKNTFWLAVAEVLSKLLKLVLLIYVARILGATEYGKFTFAFAFVYLFAILADLGIGEVAVREFARDGRKEKEFPSIFSLKILLNLGTLILIFVSSFFITSNPEIRKLIWILAIYLLMDSFNYLICCFFRARQQMQYEAFARIFQALTLTATGFFVLFNFPSVWGMSYSYLFAAASALIFLLLVFTLKFRLFRIEWNKIVWQRYLAMSWSLALIGGLTMIYNQIDSVMMGYWNQITEIGWYNASYGIAGAFLVVSSFVSTSFYPAQSKYFKESKEILQKIWNYQMEIMIFLSVPLVVGGILLASKLIGFIYDSSFSPAVLAFQILIVMTGISYLQTPFNRLLIATNQQKKLFWAVFSGTIINIILNIILIPRFSLYGAALATVFTWLVLLLLCLYITYRYTPVNPFRFKFIILKTIWQKIKTLSL